MRGGVNSGRRQPIMCQDILNPVLQSGLDGWTPNVKIILVLSHDIWVILPEPGAWKNRPFMLVYSIPFVHLIM